LYAIPFFCLGDYDIPSGVGIIGVGRMKNVIDGMQRYVKIIFCGTEDINHNEVNECKTLFGIMVH
jgi:hypothetical protein